jgi:hypothetical protein
MKNIKQWKSVNDIKNPSSERYINILMIIVVLSGFGYCGYKHYIISKNSVRLTTYAIWPCEESLFRNNHWEYIYFYNNQYYIRTVRNSSQKAGAKDVIEVDTLNPSNYVGKFELKDFERNKMIFFGEGYEPHDSICFYGDNNFLESINIDKQFGLILNLYNNVKVKLYRNDELFALYTIDIQKSDITDFYPMKIESPLKKIEKNIIFTPDLDTIIKTKDLEDL